MLFALLPFSIAWLNAVEALVNMMTRRVLIGDPK